ncbi:serine hydrolase [Haloferula rosea]|uniref:beta-lactamase n=1 Tax=Haloferula rosea TaxID=490093 RepID=A0A934RFZ4_9BACT|nr:serine hydrolase [Haloferula rosea]MBK1828476.1 metallo-hydrolase family protein [Haloferula rosea]
MNLPFRSTRFFRFGRSLPVMVLVLSFFAGASGPAARGSDLEAEINGYVKSLRAKRVIRSDERTAWLVYDFTAREKLVGINENTSLQAASMVKPYLALAFFHQVRAGKLLYGPTSRRHMELMIQKSNNASTNWVMKQTGGPAATQALLKRHYPSLCHQLSLVEYIPAGGRTYRNRGSAGDYARFLDALWNKRLPESTEMLRLMGLPGIDRLYTKAKRVPKGTMVYNKTGSTAMCCGDMGILVARGSDGRSYPYMLIGIIESGSRNRAYGPWISSRANVIREVSNLTYLSMKKRYSL